MNKIYKVIWSKARNCYVVVSEIAKRNGKCKSVKTANLNGRSSLSEAFGVTATALNKAVVALLLAGMIALPGVGEAATITAKRGTTDINVNTTETSEQNNNLAAGNNAVAKNNATAYGGEAKATGDFSTALGRGTQAKGKSSVSVGSYSTASGDYSLALGRDTAATSLYSVAVGYTATAQGAYAIAVGRNTTANEKSVVLGAGSLAEGQQSVSIGYNIRVRTNESVAIGNEAGTVVMNVGTIERHYVEGGENKTVSITINGAADTENGGKSVAIGSGAKNFAYNYDAATEQQTYAYTKYSTAIGPNAHTHASYALAIGANTDATGARAFALGSSDTSSTSPHTGARAAGQGSIVIGDQAKTLSGLDNLFNDEQYSAERAEDTNANDAIAFGTQTEARAANAIAIGGNASYTYRDGNTFKTIYATSSDGKTSGAIVGNSSDASIAIGGASIRTDAEGNRLIDTTTGTITLDYNAAAVYGKRSIAIGTGSLVESAGNQNALHEYVTDPANITIVNNYTAATSAYTDALMEYNDARNNLAQLELTNPTPPSGTEVTNPDEDGYDAWENYRTDKAAYDAAHANAQTRYDNARNALLGDAGAAKALVAASAPYETYLAHKKQLEDADAKTLTDSIAIGTNAQVRAAQSIALGDNVLIDETAHESIAIGHEAKINKTAIESIAIGEDTVIGTGSSSSIAIGNDANIGKASTQSIAIGYHAATGSEVNAVDSIAIGSNTGVYNTTGIAIGSKTQVAGMYSGAIGSEVPGLSDPNNPESKEHNSVAGDYSYVIGNGNAIGKQVFEDVPRKEGSTETIKAITRDATTSRTFVLGARNKIGTANGDSNYVYTLGFHNEMENVTSSAIIGEYNEGNTVSQSLIFGKNHNYENLQNSLIIGGQQTATTTPVKNLTGVLAYGFNATIADNTTSSILIGESITMQANESIAIGKEAQVTTGATESIAIGKGAQAKGANSISIGTGNVVTGARSGAIGDPNYVTGTDSFVIGDNNGTATQPIATNKTFIFGNNVQTTAANSVFLGDSVAYVEDNSATTATTKGLANGYNQAKIGTVTYGNFAGYNNVVGVVSVGSTTETRRIQNVAPGLVTATSTDAINGSQLYAVASKIDNSGWKVGDNTSAQVGDAITNGKQVNYLNGVGTTATVAAVVGGGANVKYDVNTTNMAAGADGKVAGAAAGNSFATAETVQTAINNAGWKVSSTSTELVKAGDEVKLTAGTGITITQTGKEFTFDVTGGAGEVNIEQLRKDLATTKVGDKLFVDTDHRSTTVRIDENTGNYEISSPYIVIHGVEETLTEEKNTENWAKAGKDAIGMGYKAHAEGENAVAVGANTNASAKDAVAIGNANKATAEKAVSIGSNNNVTGEQSIAIGTGHKIYGSRSGAFGDPTEIDASVDGSYAIGNSSHISTSDTFVLGNEVTTTYENSVFLGSKSAYVADGNTTAGMSDYSSATINGNTYNFAGGKPAGVVSVGDVGKERRIQNVAAGKVSPESTDAINGSQLYHAMNNVSGDVINMVNQQDSRMKKGLAGAAALAALHPMDFDPDDKLTFAAGVGHYRGENAGAIGMFYRPDEKVMFSVGGTFGNGENMVNAGVSFSLDRTPRVTGSRTAMAKEIVELREQVAQLTALVNQIAANQGQALPMTPAMFPNTPENKWAYDYIENLQKQGAIAGYAGRDLTRNEMAAALDRALASGVKLDERIAKEFAPELSRIRVVQVNGQVDGNARIFERPRSYVNQYK